MYFNYGKRFGTFFGPLKFKKILKLTKFYTLGPKKVPYPNDLILKLYISG